MYHEIFDLYHPYIGDKPTLYYLFLVRYRNNEEGSNNYGKSWRGRSGIVDKFQIGYSRLPVIDEILQAVGLIDIETKPSGRGRDKIFYTVNDPLIESQFYKNEEIIKNDLIEMITKRAKQGEDLRNILGKQKGKALCLNLL